MKDQLLLSLVIPCFNESEHIETSLPKLIGELEKLNEDYELIIIDDKSTDDTVIKLKKILPQYQNTTIAFIEHAQNQGRGKTVMDGINKAKGIFVGFLDIDLEISPEYIKDAIEKLKKNYDVVCGLRNYSIEITKLHRALASKCYNYLIRFILWTNLRDTEAGFKFFNREKILKILPNISDQGWFWDTEIMIRAQLAGFLLFELPVIFQRRLDKTSTVHVFSDTMNYLKKLFKFRIMLFQEYFQKIIQKMRNGILPIEEIDQELSRSGTIYEVGCGYGSISRYLSLEAKREVIGIDINQQKISKLISQISSVNLQFILADAATFEYRKAHGFVLSDFLHHVPFPVQEKILKKISMSLDNEGKLIIKEIDRDDGIRRYLSRFWDCILYPNDTIYYRSQKDWINLLKKFDLQVETRRAVKWFPGSTILYICRRKKK